MPNRRSSLSTRSVPQDVRTRLAKAGVSDFDWYAGRVDGGSGPSSEVSDLTRGRTRSLRAAGRLRRRKQAQDDKRTGWQ